MRIINGNSDLSLKNIQSSYCCFGRMSVRLFPFLHPLFSLNFSYWFFLGSFQLWLLLFHKIIDNFSNEFLSLTCMSVFLMNSFLNMSWIILVFLLADLTIFSLRADHLKRFFLERINFLNFFHQSFLKTVS